jgi:hypothetical protein
MRTTPSDYLVDLALLALACCVGEITSAFGKFYDFDFAGADTEIEALVTKAFPRRESER